MSKLNEECIEILTGAFGVKPKDAPAHPFVLYAMTLERRAKAARIAYPLLYLAIGAALFGSLTIFDATHTDSWNKLFGALVGVFSALVTFWKPDIELKQSDCQRLLSGKKLAVTDLLLINKSLALPSQSFENVVKLIGALASFLAFYLLMGK